jgi:hypothetical protein
MDLCPRSRDADGLHGKTDSFMGFDEIHGLRDHALFEAMAPLNCYVLQLVDRDHGSITIRRNIA